MARLFVVLMVLWSFPVLAAETMDSSANKNCWVEIYEDDNFDQDDPHVILEGPQEFATLKNLGGRDWTDDIESIIVGPGATVKAYSKRDFQGTEVTFTPNQRVAKLSKLNMSNEIESLRVTCAQH
jgi:hypothetical protein